MESSAGLKNYKIHYFIKLVIVKRGETNITQDKIKYLKHCSDNNTTGLRNKDIFVFNHNEIIRCL